VLKNVLVEISFLPESVKEFSQLEALLFIVGIKTFAHALLDQIGRFNRAIADIPYRFITDFVRFTHLFVADWIHDSIPNGEL